MDLLSPWILTRLAAGVVAAALFVYGAWVGLRVLRYFHLGSTSEGQLALERQFELAAAAVRVGSGMQAGALLLSLIAANQLAPQLRGAMCGHGVVHAVSSGPGAIAAAGVTSLASLVLWRLLTFDRHVRSLALLRPLSGLILAVAALSLVDLALTASWLGALDFSVVASCCSSGLDAGGTASYFYGTSGQSLALLAPPLALVAAGLAWRAARSRRRAAAVLAGVAAVVALPAVLAAIPQVVAPYAYETPHHRCAYCLFRSDALWLGYPLLGALLLACSSALGGALAAWLSPAEDGAFPEHGPLLLQTAAVAWLLALTLGVAPVVRFLGLSGGVFLYLSPVVFSKWLGPGWPSRGPPEPFPPGHVRQ